MTPKIPMRIKMSLSLKL